MMHQAIALFPTALQISLHQALCNSFVPHSAADLLDLWGDDIIATLHKELIWEVKYLEEKSTFGAESWDLPGPEAWAQSDH